MKLLYQYDPEDIGQSKQLLPKGGKGPVKTKVNLTGKIMMIVFRDAESILSFLF